jgi:hypothetical protein
VTFLERLDDELPAVWLYGAGHVGQALARILMELPLRLTWADSRAELFPAALPFDVRLRRESDSLATVSEAPPGAYFLVMTHSHALDYELVRAILRRNDFSWLGLIGSQSKAARFRSRLARDGIGAERIARLVCPIGVRGIQSKWPAAIAVGVAAQVMQEISAASELCRDETSPSTVDSPRLPRFGAPREPERRVLKASALRLPDARHERSPHELLQALVPSMDCGQESCSTCGAGRDQPPAASDGARGLRDAVSGADNGRRGRSDGVPATGDAGRERGDGARATRDGARGWGDGVPAPGDGGRGRGDGAPATDDGGRGRGDGARVIGDGRRGAADAAAVGRGRLE